MTAASIMLPMDVGDLRAADYLGWAQRAEAAGFASISIGARLAYPCHDELIVLAAISSVTSRIGLQTNVTVAPAHSFALLAKSASSLHHLSGGRFTFGIGVGRRPDDFVLSGASYDDRGLRFDEGVAFMIDAWAGLAPDGTDQSIVPAPGGPPLVIAGAARRAGPRVARWGAGWTSGRETVEEASAGAEEIRRHWTEAGRAGAPRLLAWAQFVLGDEAVGIARSKLAEYYKYAPGEAERMESWMMTSPSDVASRFARYEAAGFTEVHFFPVVPHVDQVEQLAAALPAAALSAGA